MVTNNIVASAAVLSPIGFEDTDAFAKSLLEPSNAYESGELIESRQLIASGTDHQSQTFLCSETGHKSNYFMRPGTYDQSQNFLCSETRHESSEFMRSGTANQLRSIPLSSLFTVSDSFEPSKSNDPAGEVDNRVGLLSGGLIGLIVGLLALVIVVVAVIVFRMLKSPGEKVEEMSGDRVVGFNESVFDPSRSLCGLQFE
jgi:hypothetical protein